MFCKTMIRFRMNLTACLLFGLMLIAQVATAGVKVVEPKVEMLTNPVGIDSKAPRFSWEIVSSQKSVMQTGYRILVASSEANLKKNLGDIWDSGLKISDASNYIDFGGTALVSKNCY